MTFLLKDPEAGLDYAVDWGLQYLELDTLAGSSWSVVPEEAGGVVVLDSGFTDKVALVHAGGGNPGRIYRLTNHVTTASGLTDSRSILLRVERR